MILKPSLINGEIQQKIITDDQEIRKEILERVNLEIAGDTLSGKFLSLR